MCACTWAFLFQDATSPPCLGMPAGVWVGLQVLWTPAEGFWRKASRCWVAAGPEQNCAGQVVSGRSARSEGGGEVQADRVWSRGAPMGALARA